MVDSSPPGQINKSKQSPTESESNQDPENSPNGNQRTENTTESQVVKPSVRLEYAEIIKMQDDSLQLAANGRHNGPYIELSTEGRLTVRYLMHMIEKLCEANGIDAGDTEHRKAVARDALEAYTLEYGNGGAKNAYEQEQERQKRLEEEWERERPANGEADMDVALQKWKEGLDQRYCKLKTDTETHFSKAAWQGLELVLSARCILHVRDCTLPFMIILLGKPAGNKTLPIELLRGTPNTFYTDKNTAPAWVTHMSGLSEEDLVMKDMLPKVKEKMLLNPELAPLFSESEEKLMDNLGTITRILDGQGYERDTGACGHRGYSGEYMFVWTGACVEIPYRVYKLLSALGPKMYFFRLDALEPTDDDLIKALEKDDFKQRKNTVMLDVFEYLKWLSYCPRLEPPLEKGLRLKKLSWDRHKDDTDARKCIVRFAQLLKNLRGAVTVWERKKSVEEEYGHSLPIIEDPSRAAIQLNTLARGHALSQGRTYITMEDLTIVAKTMLSTCPRERSAVFDLLLQNGGTLTTKHIATGLDISPPTARRVMEELDVIGLVNMKDSDTQTEEKEITLRPEFSWFLEDDFKWIRDGTIAEKLKKQRQIFETDVNGNGKSSEKESQREIGSEQQQQLEKKFDPERDSKKNDDPEKPKTTENQATITMEHTSWQPLPAEKDAENENASMGQKNFQAAKPKQYDGPPIPCPYCTKSFETPEEVKSHGIRVHRKKPITAKLREMGYNV